MSWKSDAIFQMAKAVGEGVSKKINPEVAMPAIKAMAYKAPHNLLNKVNDILDNASFHADNLMNSNNSEDYYHHLNNYHKEFSSAVDLLHSLNPHGVQPFTKDISLTDPALMEERPLKALVNLKTIEEKSSHLMPQVKQSIAHLMSKSIQEPYYRIRKLHEILYNIDALSPEKHNLFTQLLHDKQAENGGVLNPEDVQDIVKMARLL